MNAMAIGNIRQVLTDLIEHRPENVEHQDVNESVAAVMTVEEDLRFLPHSLRAVLSGCVLPSTIVVADCTGEVDQPIHTSIEVLSHPGGLDVAMPVMKTVDIQLVRAKGAKSFGDAVTKALHYANLDPAIRCLWLLHDDSRPADGHCLESLVEAWHNAPTACLLGAKQLDWSGENLHDVGYYAGRHSIRSLVVDGEPDQEQYDGRGDVFAVSLVGCLLPLETLARFKGINSWFGSFGEAADFCRRICLGGGRVVVVPGAKMAHRRARFEGVRSRSGEPLTQDEILNPARGVMKAQEDYYYTDQPALMWPLLWILGLFKALISSVRLLFAKRPYEACCALFMPWRLLVSLLPALGARHLLVAQATTSQQRLTVLQADRKQIGQWRDRCKAFDSQQHTVLLSPLALTHLRRRALVRWSLAIIMALVSVALILVTHWDLFLAALSGDPISSSGLLATDASMKQLAQAASTPWGYGFSTGLPAPPLPWLQVWLLASMLTLGHPAAAISLIFFLAAPLSALSFWALAGIFTRSDCVRASSGLLWACLGLALGLYQSANLPMLTVMIFLPASFAFTFRAVGLYQTEDPVSPHSSVQAAGCAALCFIPVVAAEPQLLLPLIAIFLVFLLVTPRHRTMLLLIPIPSAFAIAPTIVNSIKFAQEGAWRQLFADAMLPASTVQGGPRALNLLEVFTKALGLDAGDFLSFWTQLGLLGKLTMLVLAMVLLLAILALFLPFALRLSRMMWVVALAGAGTATASALLLVRVDAQGQVAGSVLPGVCLALMALLSCLCLLTGPAVKPYRSLRDSQTQSGPIALEAAPGLLAGANSWLVKSGRVLMVLLLLAACCSWAVYGLSSSKDDVRVSHDALPMVATDYLAANESRRILAIRPGSDNTIDWSVMRTGRGDLMDSSAALQVRNAFNPPDANQVLLTKASASLFAHADSQAVADISKLGFGGIYVLPAGGDADSEEAYQQLLSNINASDGTQSVVTGDSGTYYRLTQVDINQQGIALAGQHQAQDSFWRYLWLWMVGIVLFIYCLVALPRWGRHGREMA
ncbi:hypothetical protein CRD60_02790 [Bifidobacterium aemilianum]|uniref:Glycosyltransferase 2-like domain-containing protein n=1 Tax=Bifidobacterium aemilianum TaxID=2493120 RepID=A0A366K8Q0_9BIFI|nr:glycosyltransferase family 2 protein [Bifidobacterium aemilianum]RBP98105.1 hypothetical protein CRD60_02790 [Bifidobacterium aemilianum]